MEKIRFYFSFRSPFAAIAFYRLRRAPQFNGVEFELIPTWPDIIFGGHMDNPTDNLFKMAYIFHVRLLLPDSTRRHLRPWPNATGCQTAGTTAVVRLALK
jgi:hypothetical protein